MAEAKWSHPVLNLSPLAQTMLSIVAAFPANLGSLDEKPGLKRPLAWIFGKPVAHRAQSR
jgi:hypothetical protein